ncbi:hypothetical protein B0H14DRAFT_2597721 [Mycena olivaceomarginata]|nr:hypothetical protein B0H14DRAFT_2597721 [Mycena olivaceomarginata]
MLDPRLGSQLTHRASVLQQSLPASSESSLSTVMRVDWMLQAKLESTVARSLPNVWMRASGIALWAVLWYKRCKSDIENKYRPPDDEKVLSPVGYRLLTENIFTLALYGTSFTKNKMHPPSERSTRKTRSLYHNGLRTSFDSFNLSSSTHSL